MTTNQLCEPAVVIPFIQNYEWGKVGNSSRVAQLGHSGGYLLAIDANKPYAELWMGDHPNGPCFIQQEDDTPIPLREWSQSRGSNIPFLFKILSVNKALSIQAHPDAELAAELHREFPSIYKDPNPKPELAIALTEFKALFGFRPVTEIYQFVKEFAELADLLGPEIFGQLQEGVQNPEQRSGAIKAAYSALMNASQAQIACAIDRLITPGLYASEFPLSLIADLNAQFPSDVGVLSVFFLNFVTLQPGQCLFMGPNVPHAYLEGDIAECMTSSDNVIRGGLTPKLKDVPTLLRSLEFVGQSPQLLEPSIDAFGNPTWAPPNVPFAVSRMSGSGNFKAPSIALGLVTQGPVLVNNRRMQQGAVFALEPGASIRILTDDSSESMEVFIAFNPVK